MVDNLPWLKRLLVHNWEIKAMSLLLAAITWYAVRAAINFEMVVRDVKMDPQLKEGMAILDQSASSVDVTFRGSQDDIQRLDPRRVRAVVDLRAKGTASTEWINVGAEDIEGARGLSVIYINPSRIRFLLDQEEEKRLPVKGRTTGRPLAGEVEEVTCDPSTVILRGPARKLKSTELVYTEPIDVDGRIASFVKRVPILAPGDNWAAKIQPGEVQVHVRILEKGTKREWSKVPISAVIDPGSRRKVAIEPAQAAVTASGPSEELKSIGDDMVKVFVDCIGLTPGADYDLPVHVYLPKKAGIAVVSDPQMAHVTIQEQ